MTITDDKNSMSTTDDSLNSFSNFLSDTESYVSVLPPVVLEHYKIVIAFILLATGIFYAFEVAAFRISTVFTRVRLKHERGMKEVDRTKLERAQLDSQRRDLEERRLETLLQRVQRYLRLRKEKITEAKNPLEYKIITELSQEIKEALR